MPTRVNWAHAAMVVNEATSDLIRTRQALSGQSTSPDPRRNLDTECGYPASITYGDYKRMFDREGVATRVVSIYPDECWSVDPDVFENERKRLTPFERKWQELCESDSDNPLHYCHRADILSGIGSYGAILLGLDDDHGGDLARPAPGVDERGGVNPARRRNTRLNFLRAFDQYCVRIREFETDDSSPRFGRPKLYDIVFADSSMQDGPFFQEGSEAGEANLVNHDVHWSRVIHLADNREGSEVYGVSRMRNVFDKLMDLHKTLGSSAEMFYKGGFPGLSIELDPRVLDALNIEVDQSSIDDEMYKYMNGLRRYLSLIGMKAHSLAPQVANPTGNVTVLLESIAMSIGAPLRIFMGSEQAQLASGQDVRTWNRRLMRRQKRYLSPMVLRPLVSRLIAVGVLPPPKDNFQINWPDVNIPDEDERSKIADRRAATLQKFMVSGAWQVIQPSDFYRFTWGLTADEIKEVMGNLKLPPEITFKPLPGMEPNAGDSGVSGSSPSDPSTPGGKT